MKTARWPVMAMIISVGFAGAAWSDDVYLANGDRLSGQVLSDDGTSVVVEHEALGLITIARSDVARLVRAGDTAVDTSAEAVSSWTREMALGYNLKSGLENPGFLAVCDRNRDWTEAIPSEDGR